MKYCSKCGKEIHDEAVVCVHCGCSQGSSKPNDASSTGFAVLGFFFPLIGLILYLVWKSDYPLKAKSAGKGALIGVIVNVIFYVIYYGFLLDLIVGAAEQMSVTMLLL